MEENQVMQAVMAFSSVLAVFVMALVQFVKTTVSIPKKAVPAVGLVAGLLIGAAAYPFTELDLILRLWAGGIAGLTSTGLFELAFNRKVGYTKDPEA